MSEPHADSRKGSKRAPRPSRWDMLAALLLGLATVGSSASIYLSARWNSLESRRLSEASALRSESVRASNIAAGQIQVDVGVFVEILASRAHGDEQLARYLERRARDEFRPALAAWGRGAHADGERGGARSRARTPFELPEYRLAARDEANRLRVRADEILAEAHRANSVGTTYVMPTVLFSTVLFLAGIGPKLHPVPARAVLIAASVVLAVSTIIVILTPRISRPGVALPPSTRAAAA